MVIQRKAPRGLCKRRVCDSGSGLSQTPIGGRLEVASIDSVDEGKNGSVPVQTPAVFEAALSPVLSAHTHTQTQAEADAHWWRA